MQEYISLFILGAICITIGIFNSKGNISTLHSYHRKRVSEEDRIPFGKQVGLGMIIIGTSVIVSGILTAIDYYRPSKVLLIASATVTIIGLVIGLIIAFHAMIKYNKGIF